MDYRKYMRQIENKLGEVHAGDFIEENSWFNIVIRGLDEISRKCAIDLQHETNVKLIKPTYQLTLDKTPPTRLLALEIVLASWLGWIINEKAQADSPLSSSECLKRIEEAYNFGVSLSKNGQRP